MFLPVPSPILIPMLRTFLTSRMPVLRLHVGGHDCTVVNKINLSAVLYKLLFAEKHKIKRVLT